MQGMTVKQCSGMSIELNQGSGDSSEGTARSKKEAGYGYYMFFALGHTNSLVSDFSDYRFQVSRCQSVARGLYDEELLMPEYYYKRTTQRVINCLNPIVCCTPRSTPLRGGQFD